MPTIACSHPDSTPHTDAKPVKPCSRLSRFAALCALVFTLTSTVRADDWPQWMGPQRDGIWRETGLVESFPTNGLPVLWRVPINPSYCGPAVADGRLYVLDRKAGKLPERKRGDRSLPQIPGNERLLCLDTRTGRTLWEQNRERRALVRLE